MHGLFILAELSLGQSARTLPEPAHAELVRKGTLGRSSYPTMPDRALEDKDWHGTQVLGLLLRPRARGRLSSRIYGEGQTTTGS